MKLPIQARPIMRTVNLARISDALISGIIASDAGLCRDILQKCGSLPPPFNFACAGVGAFCLIDLIPNIDDRGCKCGRNHMGMCMC